ncbi:RDD family protein [Luteimonas notoginsengisoli]|jgi:uncharacterized RDD family membrane protein YckC|uniref:RDD family protein n=1 Tax=Luteimonas notoginsengisoli TaxID=1578200 RepID=A0ABV7UVR4_9GAMM
MNEQNPYRGPDAAVAEFSSGDELAGRGARLGAAIIDGIIMLVVVLPVMYMGGYMQAATAAAQAGQQMPIGTTLMWAAIGFVIFAVIQGFPLNATGQTWGKKALKIKIVDLAGDKPPLGRLLGLRYLPIQVVSNVPLIGPVLAIVDVLLIFRNDRRCGHDLIAGTRVVHVD